MKKLLCSPRFYLLCALISALAAGIMQTLAYQSAYGNPLANYFSAGSPLPKIAVFFSLFACALGAVAVCLWKKDEIPEHSPKGDLSSLPAAAGFFAGTAMMLLSNNTKLTYAVAVCLFVATLYHVILAFRLIDDPVIVALIGFSNVIGCILLIGYLYFDHSMEMNAPVKISVLIGILFAMLYYTNEIRVLLGNPLSRIFTLLTVCVTGIGALVSLPITLAYLFFGCFDQTKISIYAASVLPYEHPEYLACSLILLGVCAGTVWRLCRMIRSKEH